MSEKLEPKLERSLFLMNKYGLKPQVLDLEELVMKDYIDSSEVDGWLITPKGLEYLKTVSIKNENGSMMIG